MPPLFPRLALSENSRIVPNPVVTIKAEVHHPVLYQMLLDTHPVFPSIQTARTFKAIISLIVQIFTVCTSAAIPALDPFA
jgi:hypothetical protein